MEQRVDQNYIKYGLIVLVIMFIGIGVYFLLDQIAFNPLPTITTFEDCLQSPNAELVENYPRRCLAVDGQVFIEDLQDYQYINKMIKVDSPQPNQTVSSPMRIFGRARGSWYFEASFPYELQDEYGNLIQKGAITTKEDWMTEDFVAFNSEVVYPQPQTLKGLLILFNDNPSGLIQEKIQIPIIFAPIKQPQTVKLKVYFANDNLDPEITCEQVFSVIREVPYTQAIGRAALEELLKGPTEVEATKAYWTALNDNIIINSLTISEGTARVDFNDQLQNQVSGSCRVSIIRKQLEATLMQFSTVDEVIISINGEIESILQP